MRAHRSFRFMLLAAVFSAFTAGAGSAQGAPLANQASSHICTKYAAPYGSDRHGRGTARRPFRSVERLDVSLRPGQTGCLRGGNYGTPNSRPAFTRPGVTIRSAPGEMATIFGGPYVMGAGTVLSHLRFDVDNVNHVLAVGEHCQPQ